MSQASKATQTSKQNGQPFMVGAMWGLTALCVAGAAFTAMSAAPQSSSGVGVPSTGDVWTATELVRAAWMLAGAALFAAIATGLHLLHRIAVAVEASRT